MVDHPEGSGALARLRARLDGSSFRLRYVVASGWQPLVTAPERARERGGIDPEWTLFRLFALGDEVGVAELAPEDGELVAELTDEGVCAMRDGLCSTAGLIVVPALGGLLLTGLPPSHGGSHGASGYLGPDSFRLASALPPVTGRRMLDIGCGCGIQGLLAARGASEAVLTDIDPLSLRIASWNVPLNSVEHRVQLRQGSCYEPVAGERFDLVASLPPYLPVTPGSPITVAAGGGEDGLAVVVPLLEGAPEVLTETGELYLLVQLLCDDTGPLLAQRLADVSSQLAIDLFCSDLHPLRPFVVEIAGRATGGAGPEAAELAAASLRSLRSLGATGVCMALVRARSGVAPGLRVDGPRGAVRPATVLRHAGTLVTGAPWRTVGLEEGTLRPLDDLALALATAIDGQRDVAGAALAAWGSHADLDPRDLEETAAWRALELATLGLVETVPTVEDALFAPFDDEEVDALAALQSGAEQSGAEPPYRCPTGDGGVLEAEPDAWRCPRCGARQTWARPTDLD